MRDSILSEQVIDYAKFVIINKDLEDSKRFQVPSKANICQHMHTFTYKKDSNALLCKPEQSL